MVWLLIFLLIFSVKVDGGQKLFEMADRSGDDFGAGKITYPTHQAFAPYRDLFDLTHFKVTKEEEYLFFDLSFSQITNPWKAPEGFFHQHVLIFISTGAEGAKFYKPLGLSFTKPYLYIIRVAPWSLSSLRFSYNEKDMELRAETLNQQTIRVYVPLNIISSPYKDWEYAVLVGAYDPFGNDFFREIATTNTAWEFGGEQKWPFIDILAPVFGSSCQEQQLKSGEFVFQSSKSEHKPSLWWLFLLLIGFSTVLFLKWRGFKFNFGLKIPRSEHNKKGTSTIKKWDFGRHLKPQ